MGYGPPPGYPPPSGYGPQGYGPPPGYPAPGYQQPPPPQKKGMGVLGWIGLICLLGFGGCLGMCAIGAAGAKKAADDVDKKAKQEEKDFEDERAMKVSADDLIDAYEENEVKADEKYKGHKVEVSGKVAAIDSGVGDDPVVRLGSQPFKNVHVYGLSKKEAGNLSKGDKITVVCKADGEIIGVPKLKNCSVK